MSDRVRMEIADNVATVTLNRAAKRNAADMAMLSGLIETAETLAEDSSVRVVILRGDGGNFCAGIDVSIFGPQNSKNDIAERMQQLPGSDANFFQSAAMVWRELPVPVIAVLEGIAFGAGLQIAMGADVRYAARDLQMSMLEIKWGIIPDMGITTTLPGVVAQDKVRQLAYSGRIFSAAEALDAGFITELVDDPLAAANGLAAEIASNSPEAVRAIKTLLNTSWGGEPESALRREAELQTQVTNGENHAEVLRAHREKRLPKF